MTNGGGSAHETDRPFSESRAPKFPSVARALAEVSEKYSMVESTRAGGSPTAKGAMTNYRVARQIYTRKGVSACSAARVYTLIASAACFPQTLSVLYVLQSAVLSMFFCADRCVRR